MHFTLGEQLLDLAENSVEAGATRVEILWEETDSLVRLEIRDNGSGMDAVQLARATDPFYTDGTKHRERRVGLGLAFLTQTADAVGGSVDVDSTPGIGTTVRMSFPAGHIDLPPAGDPVAVIGLLLCMEPRSGELEVLVERASESSRYTASRLELIEVLEEISTVEGRVLLQAYLKSQEDEIWQR